MAWLCVAFAGCQTVAPPAPPAAPPQRTVFTPAAWSDLPGWQSDPVEDVWPAFVAGCRALVANARKRATWQAPCAAGERIDGADPVAVRAFFVGHFSPYRVAAADGSDVGLVTGYYEPLLRGSRVRTAEFAVPLYAPPDDLLTVELGDLHPELKGKRVRARVSGRKVVPYWSRAEIERDAAAFAARPLVYVDDPVEAFFLEIQGSGRVALPDGTVVRLNYADQNGHPYRSVGRVLIDRGELTRDSASMQSIRAWALAHPDQVRALFLRARGRDAPESGVEVELAPVRIGDFALALAGQDQQPQRGDGDGIGLALARVVEHAPELRQLVEAQGHAALVGLGVNVAPGHVRNR